MKKVLNVCEGISGAATVAVVVLTMLQAVMRSFFGKGLSWTNEALFMSQIMLVYLIIPVLFYEKENICVDVFVNWLPKKIHRIIWLLTEVISLVFCVIFFVSITLFLRQTWSNATAIMRIPNYIYYGSIWLGMLLSNICIVISIIKSIFEKKEEQ